MWGNSYKLTFENLTEYVEKMKNNELTLEDVLDNNDIVQDLKTNSSSEFFPFITEEIMKKLIDYVTKMPKEDDQKSGHKFPFNASEILTSNNMKIINKYFGIENENNEDNNFEKDINNNDNNNDNFNDNINDNNNDNNNDNINDDEDDVVNIKEDNNIMKNQNIKNDEQKEKILIYLLNFLKSESTNDNYVLVGYFYKIIQHLLINKSTELLNCIFIKYNDITFDGFCKHLNRKAIGECIKNLLVYNEDEVINLNEKRKILVEKIFNTLKETNDEEKCYAICDTIINCISKKNFFNILMLNQNVIDLLFQILCNNLNNDRNLRTLLNLMIKINEQILSLFDKLVTPNLNTENDLFMSYDNNEANYNEETLKNILTPLFKSIKDSNLIFLEDLHQIDNDELFTTYEKNQKKLGLKKLILVEYLRSIIDILVNTNSKNLLSNEINDIINLINQNKIFSLLNDFFFRYEFNNIYQSFYLQIFAIILNKHSPENLVNGILLNDNLNDRSKNFIPKLLEHTLNNMKFEYESKNKSDSCFFAAEIKLINDIINSNNEYVKNIINEEKDFLAFNEILVKRINTLFTQKLLYVEFNGFPNFNTEESNNIISSSKSIDEMINESINIYNKYKNGENYQKLLNEIIEKEKPENKLSISQELINEEDIKNNDINVYGDDDEFQTKGLIDDSPKNDNEKKMELENGFIEEDNDIDVIDNLNDKFIFDKNNSDEINNKKENIKIERENESDENEEEEEKKEKKKVEKKGKQNKEEEEEENEEKEEKKNKKKEKEEKKENEDNEENEENNNIRGNKLYLNKNINIDEEKDDEKEDDDDEENEDNYKKKKNFQKKENFQTKKKNFIESEEEEENEEEEKIIIYKDRRKDIIEFYKFKNLKILSVALNDLGILK